MGEPLTIRIETVRSRRGDPVAGGDTVILRLPAGFRVGGAIAVPAATDFLRTLAAQQARGLGEELHHADFVVTRSKREIASRELHDCGECRAALERAYRFLDEHPDEELLAGRLYWARR